MGLFSIMLTSNQITIDSDRPFSGDGGSGGGSSDGGSGGKWTRNRAGMNGGMNDALVE